jgi:hypothetical protein
MKLHHNMKLGHKMRLPHKLRLPHKMRLPNKMRLLGRMWLPQRLRLPQKDNALGLPHKKIQLHNLGSAYLTDYGCFISKTAACNNDTASQDDEAMSDEAKDVSQVKAAAQISTHNMWLPHVEGAALDTVSSKSEIV